MTDFEYRVTLMNSSGNEVEDYRLKVDNEEIIEETVELSEGEHNIEVIADGLKDIDDKIQIKDDRHDVFEGESADGVFVNPDFQELENLISEEFARATEDLGMIVDVNKASSEYVELYSSEAEMAEVEVADSNNSEVEHEYEYIAKVVVESNNEYRYNSLDLDEREAVYERFESPLEALREIENKILDEIDSVF